MQQRHIREVFALATASHPEPEGSESEWSLKRSLSAPLRALVRHLQVDTTEEMCKQHRSQTAIRGGCSRNCLAL